MDSMGSNHTNNRRSSAPCPSLSISNPRATNALVRRDMLRRIGRYLVLLVLTPACLALSAERRLDGGVGGYAAKSDLPGQRSREPGTKGWPFAGRRPMPDHIALSAEGDRRVNVPLAVRFAGGAFDASRPLGDAPEMQASSECASFACCPHSASSNLRNSVYSALNLRHCQKHANFDDWSALTFQHAAE